jgi:hypothetical protein
MGKENVIYLHNEELFSHKEEMMSSAGKWMALEIIMLSEISQSERQIIVFSFYMKNLDLKK